MAGDRWEWMSVGVWVRGLISCEYCGGGGGDPPPTSMGRVMECNLCGRVVLAANFARHQDWCRVWDPGGGRSPDGAKRP